MCEPGENENQVELYVACADELIDDYVDDADSPRENIELQHGKLAAPKNGMLKRSVSEGSFNTLRQLEKNYSKLGDKGYKQKGLRIKVSSIGNGLNFHGEEENIEEQCAPRDKTIVSRRGSIRGVKNRVRSGIAAFRGEEDNSRNFRQEKGKIIVYTTSMTVVRETSERCKRVRNILQNHMVRYQEKDLFMSQDNQRELIERLQSCAIDVPQVFADGVHIGGAKDIERLNESGDLRRLFENFTKVNVRHSCEKCGGYRYLPCTFCHGSKKSLHRNEFTEEFSALRCTQCNEDGLMRCDLCLDQQE